MTTPRRPRLLLALPLALALVPASAAQLTAQSPATAPECGPVSPDGNYPGWPIAGQVSSTGALLPLVISSQLVAGPPSRFLYSIAEPANPFVPTASADVSTQVAFYALARDPGLQGWAAWRCVRANWP